jgi:hypothetical protein
MFDGITLLLPALIWIVQGEGERQNAFERSLTDFLPFLPFRGEIEIEIRDYLVKIAGALTFGLLIIALRRKFERKTLGRYNSYALTRSCTNQVLCCFTLL